MNLMNLMTVLKILVDGHVAVFAISMHIANTATKVYWMKIIFEKFIG